MLEDHCVHLHKSCDFFLMSSDFHNSSACENDRINGSVISVLKEGDFVLTGSLVIYGYQAQNQNKTAQVRGDWKYS